MTTDFNKRHATDFETSTLMNTLQILHVILIFFRLNDLTSTRKETYRKTREEKRMNVEYYDFQLRWYLNLAHMGEKSNINVIMRATSITPRKLYDLINRSMVQSYLIDYLTLLKRKTLLLCLKFNEWLNSFSGESKHLLRKIGSFFLTFFFLWFHITCRWGLILWVDIQYVVLGPDEKDVNEYLMS